jgi:hypothetical protein
MAAAHDRQEGSGLFPVGFFCACNKPAAWAGLGRRLPWLGSSVLQRLAHPDALPQAFRGGCASWGASLLEMNISGSTTLTQYCQSVMLPIEIELKATHFQIGNWFSNFYPQASQSKL